MTDPPSLLSFGPPRASRRALQESKGAAHLRRRERRNAAPVHSTGRIAGPRPDRTGPAGGNIESPLRANVVETKHLGHDPNTHGEQPRHRAHVDIPDVATSTGGGDGGVIRRPRRATMRLVVPSLRFGVRGGL
jgi:hypothetical protein